MRDQEEQNRARARAVVIVGSAQSRSATNCCMTTLIALGYLELGASSKRRLGLCVTDLGMPTLNSTRLCEHVHPI
jgi:DNA-binding IclR family transcriptional regulator